MRTLARLLILLAGLFAVYEAIRCTASLDRTTSEMKGLTEDLRKRDEAVAKWQKTQEKIAEDQRALIRRLDREAP